MHHEPTILVVGRTEEQFTANGHERWVFAHADDCDSAGNQARVRRGTVVKNGTRSRLFGTTLFTPDVVLACSKSEMARRVGLALVISSSALWGHTPWLSKQSSRVIAANGACPVVYALVEFAPTGILSYTICDDEKIDRHIELTKKLDRHIADLMLDTRYTTSPQLHKTLGLCSLTLTENGVLAMHDALPDALWRNSACTSVQKWIERLRRRTATPLAIEFGTRCTGCSATLALSSMRIPSAFGTPRSVATEHVSASKFIHLDNRLITKANNSQKISLDELLLRVTAPSATRDDHTHERLIEPGVGRSYVVPGLQLESLPHFHDFTVLGGGLTPFSEGGYVNVGRLIDGKAALRRALHRKHCADRLEEAGCRAGLVVAIASLPSTDIEMPDGTRSPSALVVRAFRCVLRIKQLDPLISMMHSIQHTPLVFAWVLDHVRTSGGQLPSCTDDPLWSDELLGQALEQQDVSQEALRRMLGRRDGYLRKDVRAARLAAVSAWSRPLIDLVISRLAADLEQDLQDIGHDDYLLWFARCLGDQLAGWKSLRFLHDYHHPGVSRYTPQHLYTLGENNITLLAEFPDLDTGVFVDDHEDYIQNAIQISPRDVSVLREKFELFHSRDVESTKEAVRTLSGLLFPDNLTTAAQAMSVFEQSYRHASGQ